MKKSKETVEFQASHFAFEPNKVFRNGVDVQKVVGYDLSDENIWLLSGAMTGSEVSLTEKREWTSEEIPDGEDVPAGLLFTVKNDSYLSQANEVVLYLDGHLGVSSIYVKLVMFKPNESLKGIAGHMISKIVEGSNALPKTRRIKLLAAGGRLWEDRVENERWGGYVAWPKYGFDANLPNSTKSLVSHFPHHPKNLKACQTVSSVINVKGGREFWHTAGDGDYMNFDLQPLSLSLKRLESFLSGEKQ